MKKKKQAEKLDLKKMVIGTLNQQEAVKGGLRQLAAVADTNQLTGCGMTCWSYGNYCFLSENCA